MQCHTIKIAQRKNFDLCLIEVKNVPGTVVWRTTNWLILSLVVKIADNLGSSAGVLHQILDRASMYNCSDIRQATRITQYCNTATTANAFKRSAIVLAI